MYECFLIENQVVLSFKTIQYLDGHELEMRGMIFDGY